MTPQPIQHTAAALIFNDRNELLLLLRDDAPMWCLIGGYMDDGETPLQGLAREMLEETGLVMADFPQPELLASFERFYVPEDRVTHLTHIHRLAIGTAKPQLGHEGVALRFFSLDDAPENIFGIQYDIIFRYKNDKQLQNDRLITHGLVHRCNRLQPEQFIGLESWSLHPRVMEKRRKGQLRFDPLSEMPVFTTSRF